MCSSTKVILCGTEKITVLGKKILCFLCYQVSLFWIADVLDADKILLKKSQFFISWNRNVERGAVLNSNECNSGGVELTCPG